MMKYGNAIPAAAVIGAGPAGISAALAAASCFRGRGKVLLFERRSMAASKILSTGNGRCNITNEAMGEEFYHSSSGFDCSALFREFTTESLLAPLTREGVFFHSRGGYVYPADDRAATVREAMEAIARSPGITYMPETGIADVRLDPEAEEPFILRSDDGRSFAASKLVITCGGLAAPAAGSTGDGLSFAGALGHRLVRPLPALVPLTVKENYVHFAGGVRTEAVLTLTVDGRRAAASTGEVQFTRNGISGIPVFQLSAPALRALDEGRRAVIEADFISPLASGGKDAYVPAAGFNPGWEDFSRARVQNPGERTAGRLFDGAVHPDIGRMTAESLGIPAEKKAARLDRAALEKLIKRLSSLPFTISGSAGFERAQTTSGGVAGDELTPDGESRLVPGLFFAGEVVDVDGLCGGYNLTFAMLSGRAAGTAAARSLLR